MAEPDYPFIPHTAKTYEPEEMIDRSAAYFAQMNTRRTVRDFSSRAVPREVIENIIKTASTAPSGANKQPFTFVVISNEALKKKIRHAAEAEEYKSYHGRMSDEWLKDLAPLGTDWHKPFIEIAPWIIVVFKQPYREENGKKLNNYYVSESVGLACGFLLSAIHHAGLVALTHTPSPMNFLAEILERPSNERPFLLIPVGYPAVDAKVPDIQRKPLDQVAVFLE